MAWRIEGAGYFYEFPSRFDLTSHDRANAIPSRVVHGGDGAVIDKSVVRREATTHVLRGLIKGTSVANALAQRDEMEDAINAMPDEVFLVDTASNRRVAVKLVNSRIPREPASILNISLFFRTSDNPYWEESAQTKVTSTLAGWTDIETGGQPAWGEMSIAGSISSPTIVQGNWSFISHIDRTQATALNSGETSVWGQITGNFQQQILYSSSAKFGQSLAILGNNEQGLGNLFRFWSMSDTSDPSLATAPRQRPQISDRINLDQFTLSFWVNTQWEWNDSKEHNFIRAQSNQTTGRLNILKGSNNRLQIQYGDQTLSYDSTSNRANKWHHIAVRGSSLITVEASNYIELFVDGSVATSHTTQPTAQKSAPQFLRIGSNAATANSSDALFDEMTFWGVPLSSTMIKSTLYNGGTGRLGFEVEPLDITTYFSFDGTSTLPASSEQTLFNFTGNPNSLIPATRVSSVGTAVKITSNGTLFFKDNDRLTVSDEKGFFVFAYVNGAPSNQTIPVDNNSGGLVTDLDKVGQHVKLNGLATAGTIEVASGSTAIVQVGNGNLGIGVWFRRNGIPTTHEAICDKRGDFSSTGYQLYVSSAGSLVLAVDDGTNELKAFAGANSLLDNRWHHVWAFMSRVAAASAQMFFNSTEETVTTSGVVPTGTVNNTSVFTVGAVSGGATGYFNGSIAALRLQDGAGHAQGTQVRYQASHPLDFTQGDFFGWSNSGNHEYWEFSEGTGLTVDAGIGGGNLSLATTGAWNQQAYVTKNLIADGWMENGGIGGWVVDQATSIKKVSSRGGNALRLRNPVSSTKGVNREIDVTTNENLVWRGMYRQYSPIAGAGTNAQVRFQINGTLRFRDFGTMARWKMFEHCYDGDLPTGNKDFEHFNLKGHAEFDKMELVSNLIVGGCETLADWTQIEQGTSAVKLDTDFHSFANAALCSVDASGSTAGIKQGVSVATSKFYHVGFWAKSDSGTPTILLRESFTNGLSTLTDHAFTLGTDWSRQTRFLKVQNGGAATIRIDTGGGAASRLIRIDDVSVTELDNLHVLANFGSESIPVIQLGKYGFGRNMSGSKYTFSSLLQRTDKLAFMVRFRANSAWSTLASSEPDKYFFDFNDGSSALGSHHYAFYLKEGRYVFGNSLSTIGAQATTFVEDKDIDVGVWLDTAGTTVNSATVRARMFENAAQIASVATFSQASVSTLTKLFIGTDRDSDNPAGQIVDELYFWHQNQGDGFIKGEQAAQRKLFADNNSFSYNSSVAAGDYLLVDHQKQTVRLYDTSVPTLVNKIGNLTGNFFQLGEGNAHGRHNMDTLFTRQAARIDWKYRKLYY